MKFRCMVKKLSELDETFYKQLSVPINEPEMQSGGGGVDETGSVFSLVESWQEEFRDVSLEEKVVGRETDEIKKNRYKDLVSFGLVGFIAGMVNFYGYLL